LRRRKKTKNVRGEKTHPAHEGLSRALKCETIADVPPKVNGQEKKGTGDQSQRRKKRAKLLASPGAKGTAPHLTRPAVRKMV